MCSFSSARVKILIVGSFFLTSVGVARADLADVPLESTAENQQTNNNQSISKTKDPQPPALPQRQVPAPPAVPICPSNQIQAPKASLSWRQKTLNLSMDKYKNIAADSTKTNQLLRLYQANYSDILIALASSCTDCGFKVDFLNSSAGELLASSADGKLRLVFSFWEQSEGKTCINAGVDQGNKIQGSKATGAILDSISNCISKRGRI